MKRRSLRPWLWMLTGFLPGLALAIGIAIGMAAGDEKSAPDLSSDPMFRGMPVRAFGAASGESYALTTGPVDSESEAIYALDFLTGDLYAWVFYPRVGQFGAKFGPYNVTTDLQSEAGKTPSYVMVAGQCEIRGPGGQSTFANSILYVADSNTGRIAAYTIPWDRTLAAQNAPQAGTFGRLGVFTGRNAAIRK
jgi:hypothetical protein